MIDVTTKSDQRIQQDVLTEFRWDARINPTEVGVQVCDGIVALSGTIDSYAKKLAAGDAAHRVAGVLDVVNDLVVAPPHSHARQDQDIARAVRHTLEWDVLIPNERIRTTVSQGFVTLEGELDRWLQRLDAERAVERLAGVRGVYNRISIRPDTRVDTQKIRHAIEAALDRQAHREADRIGLSVKDGVVTLTGTVRSWAEKKAVRGVVGFAPGVRRVDDRLTIDSCG
jgi:osmotically-inducible protein OsmY